MSNTYSLSTSNRRIWSRILDFIFIYMFIITIDVLIVMIDTNKFKTTPNHNYTYILLALVLLVLNFTYFILIPFLNKKGTLFNIALKVSIANIKGNRFINLIKKELFI